MRTRYLLVASALGLGLALALLRLPVLSEAEGVSGRAAPVSAAPAAELHVCPSGCAYSSVQAAVDAATAGDVIKVAAGIYTGVQGRVAPPGYWYPPASGLITQVVYITKTVTILGGYTTFDWTTPDPGGNPTTLDAQQQGRVLLIAGDISPTIAGLRLTGGDADGLNGGEWAGGTDAGGGICVFTATATISQNWVDNNAAQLGGGIWLDTSDATISGNEVTTNTAHWGGGLKLVDSDATLSANTIFGNTANDGGPGGVPGRGGGVDVGSRCDATLQGNTVSGNTADSNGGGVSLTNNEATLNDNTISSNTAITGGGVYIVDSSTTLISNTISANTASNQGGGIYLKGESDGSDAALIGNTFVSNDSWSGGGLKLVDSDAMVEGNTFISNTACGGGGVEVMGSNATFESNTFMHNIASCGGGGLNLAMFGGTLESNLIVSNTAPDGGGVLLFGGATWANNVIADNHADSSGSALLVRGGSLRLLHTTLARNSGGDGSAIYVDWAPWVQWYTSVDLINTILVDHGVGISVTGGNTVTVDSLLWHSTPITVSQSPTAVVTVQNEITGDPAFAADGYHLTTGSGAIDAGIDAGLTTDIDGQMRPMSWGYDLGADEYPGAHLAVVKQASAAVVNPGQALTYTIVVTSTGEENATGVVLTDTLDGWQRPLAATASVGGCTIPDAGWGGSAVCTPGLMVTGTTRVVTLTAEVSTSVAPAQAMVNTVVAKASETAGRSAGATTYGQDCHARIDGSATEYTTVQAAVDAASPDDVVKVAGTCIGVNTRAGLRQQVYLDKSLTLRGGYTTANWTTPDPEANPTTLDALGQGRVLYISDPSAGSGQAISPTIEGLRVTGGSGWLGGPAWEAHGGGLYVNSATATLKDNRLSGNVADWGGGLFVTNGNATLRDNTIHDNTASFCAGLLLAESDGTLSGETITGNTATDWSGGGGCLMGGDAAPSAVSLDGVVITGNTAGTGGGGLLLAGNTDVTMTNSVVADNQATYSGGGLRVIDSSAHLVHTTLARNTAGAGSGVFVQGIDLYSTVALTNTIMADHSEGIHVTGGNTVTVDGILWHNVYVNVSQSPTATVTLQNQHWGDTAFVNPDGGDYHLFEGSAAIDRGVDAGIGVDMDGDPRPIGAGYDLGADEYPCGAVSNAQLDRAPSGDLFTGNVVRFTAVASGTLPLAYAWTLDGTPVGKNRSTFEHTFPVSDTYTVGVTVTNGCGQDSATMIVVVADAAPQQPDLSSSYKAANLTNVEAGDTLTYTLFLRNRSAVTASAVLTDPIPAYTTYVPGSAQASDGSAVTVDGGQLSWSGQVITGTPVVIQFAVEVQAAAVGTPIANVAVLDDGLGNVMELAADSIYNPGYGLTIDDGALYTAIPTVTLRYSWNVADEMIYVRFSNDGGFVPGDDTSDWLPVNAADPTYADWVLATYGDLRMPRTVYAKFRDGTGLQVGPIQDDIVYDPVAPQVAAVEVITNTDGRVHSAMAGQDVIVRVTTSDDNSGASRVQISHSADLAQYSEFPVTGVTTDIDWTLQPSGEIYLRVVDRAGNPSDVESAQGPPRYEIYLPLVLRSS
jgi:uncharacterized repeat protein (TIGR01451 family)